VRPGASRTQVSKCVPSSPCLTRDEWTTAPTTPLSEEYDFTADTDAFQACTSLVTELRDRDSGTFRVFMAMGLPAVAYIETLEAVRRKRERAGSDVRYAAGILKRLHHEREARP
jgi:hypothetical protein